MSKNAMEQLLKDSGSISEPESKAKQEVAEEPTVEASATEEASTIEVNAEETPESSQQGADPVNDAESLKKRALDSLQDEIKKLRKESAARRNENKVLKEQAAELFEAERKAMQKKIVELEKKANVAAEKSKDEAKEEGQAVDTAKIDLILAEKQKELEKQQKRAEKYETQLKEIEEAKKEEDRIRKEAVELKVSELLTEIPEEKRKFASSIVKGHEDPQEGYLALLEAKQEGLFGVKKVEVAHQVPKNPEPSKEENKLVNNRTRISKGLKSITSGGVAPGQRII